MAENDPGAAFPVRIEGAVQAFPFRRGDRTVGPGHEGTGGSFGPQDRGAAVAAVALETGKHEERALPGMYFRRPVVAVCPEGTVVFKAGNRIRPVFQVGAGIDVKAGGGAPAAGTAGAVEIIDPVVQQDKGVPDIDFIPLHGWFPFQGAVCAGIAAEFPRSPA